MQMTAATALARLNAVSVDNGSVTYWAATTVLEELRIGSLPRSGAVQLVFCAENDDVICGRSRRGYQPFELNGECCRRIGVATRLLRLFDQCDEDPRRRAIRDVGEHVRTPILSDRECPCRLNDSPAQAVVLGAQSVQGLLLRWSGHHVRPAGDWGIGVLGRR